MGKKSRGSVDLNHTGHISQTFIYLGKLFRMFIYQNDWKVLPMSAIIAGLVSFAVGRNLFKTMEGTLTGTFALSCICIWNGFFNSIQSVCRERAIVKREHRSGLHITSYVLAHMIYQALLCGAQSAISIGVCSSLGVVFPESSLFTGWALADIWITMFLITFCADMLALFISSICRTTTTAMTIMPFLLIVQLVFCGTIFPLPESVKPLSNMTISRWGLTALCAQGDYNSLPMVTLWNSAVKMENLEVQGQKPLKDVLVYIEQNNMRDDLLKKAGEQNQKPEYAHEQAIVINSWNWLLIWTLVYSLGAVFALELIDKDKR